MVTCLASGSPRPLMDWLRPNQDGVPKSMDILEQHVVEEHQQDDEVTFTLVIQQPSPADKGDYYCSARNPTARVIQKFTVGGEAIPEEELRLPHIAHVHMNMTGENRRDMMITCLATGVPPPLLSWQYSSGTGQYRTIWPERQVRMEGSQTDTSSVLSMVVSQASREDDGLYRCSAVNRAGSTGRVIKIQQPDGPPEKLELPHIKHVHINRTGEAGRKLMVTCQALGTPAPEMRWLRKREDDAVFEIIGGHAEGVMIEQFKGADSSTLTLTITDPQPEDWGANYTCYAINYAGNANQGFVLDQQVSPEADQQEPHIEHIHVNRTGVNRENLMITCVSLGRPAPHMNIFQRNERGDYSVIRPSREEDVYFVQVSGESVLAVTLTNPKNNGSGDYRCEAANIAGTVRHDFDYDVKALRVDNEQSPHIYRIHIVPPRGLRREMSVVCQAVGNPLPVMNWWRYSDGDFKWVRPNARTEIISSKTEKGRELSLRIKDATEEDDGEYLCSATNYVGTFTHKFRLKVDEAAPENVVPARISWLHLNRTGPSKRGLAVFCLGWGNPAPEMLWYKRDNAGRDRILLPSESILMEQEKVDNGTVLKLSIPEPQDTDEGVYTCHAANVGGAVEYSINAVLSDKPLENQVVPQVKRIHINRTGENGQDISMFCVATGFPSPDIKWLRDSGSQKGGRDYHYVYPAGRVSVTENRGYNETTATLVLQSARDEDAGNYLCVANNIAGDAQQAFDVATKYTIPENAESPHIEWIHMNRSGLNDRDLTITCVATGFPPPQLNFYRGTDQSNIIGSSARKIFYQVRGASRTTLQLTYRNVGPQDAGPHLCGAANVAGHRSHKFIVADKEPEIVDIQRPHVSLIRVLPIEGEEPQILLSCQAEGNPAPELNWWRNQGTPQTSQYSLLWPGDQYEIVQSKGANTTVLNLTIKHADEASLDTYLCSAANRGGEVRQSFQLTSIPTVTDTQSEPEVERLVFAQTDENTLTLNCQAEGQPSPQLQIFRLNPSGYYQLLQPTERISFFETDSVGGSHLQVTINQATSSDHGTYLCSAANEKGAAREVADYTVQDAPYDEEEAPHISWVHLNRTGDNNADVMVTCIVRGVPAPAVTWSKDYSVRGGLDYRPLPPVATYRVRQEKFDDHTIGVLLIRRAGRREEGWYRCNAANTAGKANQQFELVVQGITPSVVPPHIGRIHVNRTGVNKEHLTLTCVASGEPAPGLQFYKQSQDGNFYLVLPDSDDAVSERRGVGQTTLQMVIDDFDLEDFGKYRCSASNLGGRVSHTFTVRIEDMAQEGQEEPFIDRVYVQRAGEGDRDVTVTCVATGVPSPDMRWLQRDYTGNEVVWPKDRYQVTQRKADGYSVILLTIKDATYANDGSLICEATNVVEQSQQAFSLRVFATPPGGLSAPAVKSVYVNQTGLDVNIYCVASGLPAPDLYISRLDQSGKFVAVQPSVRKDFSQTKDRQRTVLRLTVRDASLQDAGQYVCTATSLTGTSRSKFDFSVKSVTPESIPGSPYIRRVSVEQPKSDADVLTIHCVGQGDPVPNMALYRRDPRSGLDQLIQAGGRYSIDSEPSPDSVRLNVAIEHPQDSDSGLYICRASNSKGNYGTKFNLTVQEYTASRKGQPEFIQPRVERTGVNGVDVTVTCRARGDPAPDLLFLRQSDDGYETTFKAITTDGRYIVEEEKTEILSKLIVTIRGAVSSDAGTYVCSARNIRGSQRQQFKLSIQDIEVLPGKVGSLQTQPSENSIRLNWTPPEDTLVPVTGYRIGYGLGFPDLLSKFVDADQLTFSLENLNPEQEYILTVRAVNERGEGPPTYATETTAQKQNETFEQGPAYPVVGLKANLTSPTHVRLSWVDPSAGGVAPLYTVRYWSVAEGRGAAVYEDSSEPFINIRGLTPGERYRFSVRRGHGPWSYPLQVTLRGESQIPVDTGDPIDEAQEPQDGGRPTFGGVQVARGGENSADVIITCQSDGEPAPVISFFREDPEGVVTPVPRRGRYLMYPNRVEKGTSLSLTIRQATAEDAGIYICQAENNKGKNKQRFTITIQESDVGTKLEEDTRTAYPAEVTTTVIPPTVPASRPYFDDVIVRRTGPTAEDVTVLCRAYGQPPPQISVSKYDDTINQFQQIQGDRFRLTDSRDRNSTTATLVIHKAVSDIDRGAYLCSARNPYGTAEKRFQLKIQETVVEPGTVPDGNVLPKFEDVKVDRSGTLQKDVVVTCRVSGTPVPDLNLWREVAQQSGTNYQPIQTGGRYTVEVSKAEGYSVLRAVITDATSDDAGAYICSGQNSVGSMRQQFSLTIEDAPTQAEGFPKVVNVEVDRSGDQNQDVVIRCRVRGLPPPDLRLARGSASDIQTGGRYRVSERKYSTETILTVVIGEATSADAGTYYCTARNTVGFVRQEFELTIAASEPETQQTDETLPKFVAVEVERSGAQQQDVMVRCRVGGLPPPDLLLYRGRDQQIQTGGRYNVSERKYAGETILTVVIRDATSADAGTYLCSASNSKGTVRQQFELTIDVSEKVSQESQQSQVGETDTGRPGLPRVESVEVDRTGQQNQHVVVTCTVSGTPAPDLHLWREVTLPEGTSYQPVQTGERYRVESTKSLGSTTLRGVIYEASSEDAGNYICSARNSAGSIRQQFELTIGQSETVEQGIEQGQQQVEKPSRPPGFPKFESVNVDRAGSQRQDVVVSCRVSGTPSPDIRLWREVTGPEATEYQPVQTEGRTSVQTRNYEDYSILRAVIRDASSSDAGNYMCSASSVAGQIRQQFSLTIGSVEQKVQEKSGDLPDITDISVERTGAAQGDVRIQCTATGSPAPTLQLWKNPNSYNKEQLQTTGRVIVATSQLGEEVTLSVTVQEVTSEDAGPYQCVAANSRGVVRTDFNLTVEVGSSEGAGELRIAGVSVDASGDNNEDVTITCTGHGDPAPNMRLWRYQPGGGGEAYKIVGRSSRISLEQRRGVKKTVFRIVIRQSTKQDAGTYICSATNKDGTVRQAFDITVEESVVTGKDLPKLGNMTVVRQGPDDANALITCYAGGNPPPDVKLFKQNPAEAREEYTLLESGGRLIVNEATSERGTVLTAMILGVVEADQGVYMCQASNRGGTVKGTFRWAVEGGPSQAVAPAG